MRQWISPAIAVLALVGFTFVVAGSEAASEASESTPCYKPVAPIGDLMEQVDDIFDNIGKQAKVKKFKKARQAANLLAEVMNVVRYHSSEEVTKDKMKKWKKIAVEVRDGALEIAANAKKKDGAKVKSLLGELEDTCETCHDLRD